MLSNKLLNNARCLYHFLYLKLYCQLLKESAFGKLQFDTVISVEIDLSKYAFVNFDLHSVQCNL